MVTLLLLACTSGKPDPGTTAIDTAPEPIDSGTTDSDDTGTPTESTPPVDTGLFDGDGDGAWDAVDCDPLDPNVYPGAPDWCDALDQDCDGDPIGPGMCGELAPLTAVAAREWWADSDFPYHSVVTQIAWRTSEGEYLAGGTECWDADEEALAHACIGATRGGSGPLSDDSFQMWTNADEFAQVTLTPIGDFNGDGYEDLATGGGDGRGFYRGAVFLLSGNVDDWGGSYGQLVDNALAWWEQDRSADDFGEWVSGEGDLDGDGFDDMLVTAPLEDDDGDLRGDWFLIRGREGDFPRGALAGTEISFGLQPGSVDDDYQVGYVVPDLDGDGTAEVVVVQRDRSDGFFAYGVRSGPDLLELDGADVADVFGVTLYPSFPKFAGLEEGPRLGDYDGDGIADLLTHFEEKQGTDERQCYAVVSGAALGVGAAPEETPLSRMCEDGPSAISTGFSMTHDLDGDALLDPVFTHNRAPLGEQPACVLPTVARAGEARPSTPGSRPA